MNKRVLLSLLCLTLSVSVAFSQMQTPSQVKLTMPVAKLLNKDIQQRQEAYDEITNNRKQLIVELVSIVRQPTKGSADAQYSKFLSIKLLGNLRANEAIKILVKNLLFVPKQGDPFAKFMATQEYYPAAVALVAIGNPCIPLLTDKMATTDSAVERNLAAWIVMQIQGKDAVMFYLNGQITKKAGIAGKRLQQAKDYLETFKPTSDAPANDDLESDPLTPAPK